MCVGLGGTGYVGMSSRDGWERARTWQDRGIWGWGNGQVGLGCVVLG